MERSKIMTKNLVDGLRAKYPEQFNDLTSIECDDGWCELLDRLFAVVKHEIGKEDCFKWTQIKEKFGGLRAYCSCSNEHIGGAIAMAECMSYITCEVTGKNGKLRKRRVNSAGEIIPAWMKTLCDEEATKAGYV